MDRKPLGSEVHASLQRNCLLCSRWIACRDPNKDIEYACSKFNKEHDFSLEEVFERGYEEDKAYASSGSGLLLPNNSITLSGSGYNSDIQVVDGEHEDSPSMSDIIHRVLNSGVPVPPDLRVDDRALAKPKNIVEWITDDRFVGGDDPFGKQIQIMTHYLAEWCPKCSDEEYFEDVPVKHRIDKIKERVIFLENGVCPHCKLNKAELMEDHDLHDPFELVGIVGQRGSKTISATMIESYNWMRWATTSNIPATYNIKSSTIITFTYTATTFNQVKENFWQPYDSLISQSEWFKQYHRMLDDLGNKYGEELYKRSETMIAYRHKNMYASPASPSQRALRGRTRASATIDEAGWFKVGKTKGGMDFERMNGTEVYTALKRSLTTLRSAYLRRREAGYYNLPKTLMTLISSPSARNDLIMTKFRETQGSRETYSFKYPTWKFNPLVPRKDLDEEFRIRPMESNRDYGCEPPMASSPWISDEKLVEGSFSGKPNAVTTKTRRYRTKSRKLVTSASYGRKGMPDFELGGVMALDAGAVNNSFAIVIAYPTTIPDHDDEDEEDIFVGVSIPIIVEVIPKREYPISFTGLYNEIIKPMCEEYNVACVVSDTWQNKKIVQDLDEALGIEHFEIKASLTDFSDYKQCLYDELIVHPKLDMPMEQILNMPLDNYPDCFAKSPVAHLAFQMLTVQDAGNAIVKGEDGTTDDILRACVLAHTAIQDEEILDICYEYQKNRRDIAPPVVSAAFHSSGKSSTNQINDFGALALRSGGSLGGNAAGIGVKIARR